MDSACFIYIFIHICVFVIIPKERGHEFENEQGAAWEMLEREEGW